MANPPHLAAGRIQPFTVAAEGTEAGPLPEPTPDEMPPEEGEAASDEESAPEDEEAGSE